MTDYENVCQLLKQQSAIDYVIPAGRANTLLYAFFKTLPEKSIVLFPEINTCVSWPWNSQIS